MSLPAVQWRYVGRSYIGAGTINPNNILDKVYELCSSSQYVDGSPRIQGSGSAGVWNKFSNSGTGLTEALYVTPPSGNQKIIIAGASGTPSPSPTMNSSIGANSLYYANKLFVNITKNPGNFSAWNSGNPFTSGNAFGYVPFLGSRTSQTAGITSFGPFYAYLFESRESIALFLIENNGATNNSYSNGFIAGAIIDADSSLSVDSESDGRLYGILSTGHIGNYSNTIEPPHWATTSSRSTIWPLDWHSYIQTEQYHFFYGYSTITNGCGGRGGVFLPGSSAVDPIVASHVLGNVAGSNITKNFITPGDKYIRYPILMKSVTNSVVYGSLRGIKYCSPGIIGQSHSNQGATVGYVVSCSNNPSFPADAVLLEH